MNIYHISQDVNDDYDTYDSAVVYAKSRERARNIPPYGRANYGWCSPEYVKVEYLGIAKPEVKEEGVICASYNAG